MGLQDSCIQLQWFFLSHIWWEQRAVFLEADYFRPKFYVSSLESGVRGKMTFPQISYSKETMT